MVNFEELYRADEDAAEDAADDSAADSAAVICSLSSSLAGLLYIVFGDAKRPLNQQSDYCDEPPPMATARSGERCPLVIHKHAPPAWSKASVGESSPTSVLMHARPPPKAALPTSCTGRRRLIDEQTAPKINYHELADSHDYYSPW